MSYPNFHEDIKLPKVKLKYHVHYKKYFTYHCKVNQCIYISAIDIFNVRENFIFYRAIQNSFLGPLTEACKTIQFLLVIYITL